MQKQFIPAIVGIGITTIPLLQISSVCALELGHVGNIVDRVVSIKTPSSQGSGVIIKHIGNTYTILTAAHVVNDRSNLSLEIITADLQHHQVPASAIEIAPDNLDLATITFQSNQHYSVATIGDSSTISRGQNIFAAGFLGSSLQFYPGTVVAISHRPQAKGYGIVLGNADILPGMSGGGLFTETGVLIGIDGKGVGQVSASGNKLDLRNRFKPVSGLAIPINTFTQVASQMRVDVGDKPTATIATIPTADDFFVAAQHKSEQGDYHGAITDYDQTLSLNPNLTEVYFRRGIARSLVKNWHGAAADYTQAIATKPDYTEAYIQRGSIRNVLSDWRGAKSDFDFAIALNPQLLSAYVGRGTALCELNECQTGLQDYNRAIELNPTYAYAYSSRGFAYQRLGNKQSAISSYLAAAEIYRHEGKDRDYLDTVQKIKALVRG